jgi:hypothetical protein
MDWIIFIHLEGSRRGEIDQFQRFPVFLGRDPDSHILFDPLIDQGVSKIHAQILRKENGFFLKDLESTNGTWLNDTAVKEAILKEGDKIRLGNRGPLLKVSFQKVAIPSKEELPNTIKFSTNFQQSKMSSEMKEYQLLIMQDIFKAISWRFKILYGIIFFLLLSMLALTLYRGPFVTTSPSSPGASSQAKEKSKEEVSTAQKEMEKFFSQNALHQQKILAEYESKIQNLILQIESLKKNSKKESQEKIKELEVSLNILKGEIAQNKPSEAQFKKIQQSYEGSILFVYSQITLLFLLYLNILKYSLKRKIKNWFLIIDHFILIIIMLHNFNVILSRAHYCFNNKINVNIC